MTAIQPGAARWSSGSRGMLYAAVNLVFSLGVIVASLAGQAPEPRTMYLCLLMLGCSAPLLWMEQLNGRFTLLGIFLAAYFVFYGGVDVTGLLDAHQVSGSHGLLSAAEFGILLGALLLICGYHVALGTKPRRTQPPVLFDWPMSLIVVAGFTFWCAGTATDWFWQLNITSVKALDNRDPFVLVALVLARMLQPLGTIMVAYALLTTRNRMLLGLMIAMILAQFMVGFIGNSKEIAMRSLIILIMAAFLLRGRVPKVAVVTALAFIVLAFPIFQAYRAEVIGVRGMSRTAAAADIVRSFKLALGAKEKLQKGISDDYRVPSFLERSNLKPLLELFMERTGDSVQFQRGATLSLYFTGFIPRLIWPDKPDASIGKLVNQELRVSEDPDTYISATHLGELYWNFGWPGIVVGMFALGFLLGFINARIDLSEGRNLTRLLVFISVVYAAVVRFEGSIAIEYIVLTRALVMIWLMHLLFARVPVASHVQARTTPGMTPRILAPQLMR